MHRILASRRLGIGRGGDQDRVGADCARFACSANSTASSVRTAPVPTISGTRPAITSLGPPHQGEPFLSRLHIVLAGGAGDDQTVYPGGDQPFEDRVEPVFVNRVVAAMRGYHRRVDAVELHGLLRDASGFPIATKRAYLSICRWGVRQIRLRSRKCQVHKMYTIPVIGDVKRNSTRCLSPAIASRRRLPSPATGFRHLFRRLQVHHQRSWSHE